MPSRPPRASPAGQPYTVVLALTCSIVWDRTVGMRAKWFGVLVVVSRFFCFHILMIFAGNKEWRTSLVWRVLLQKPVGGYMRGSKAKQPGRKRQD